MSFVTKSIGRGLTEYRHVNFDELVKTFKYFYKVSQNDHIEGLEFIHFDGFARGLFNNDYSCGIGQVVYGWNKDTNAVTKLISIIDSSD